MSKVTNAVGTIKLNNGNRLNEFQIKQVLEMLDNNLDFGEYPTTLFVNESNEDEPNYELFIQNDYKSDFFGQGFNSYINNATHLFEWLLVNADGSQQEKRVLSILNMLNDNDVTIDIEFYEHDIDKPKLLTWYYFQIKPCVSHDRVQTKITNTDVKIHQATCRRLWDLDLIDKFVVFDTFEDVNQGYIPELDIFLQYI